MKLLSVLALSAACLLASAEEPPAVLLKASTMTGQWMLNGSVRAVRFELKPNGTFAYRGYGSESKGRWNVEGAKVRLRWSHVDSVPVDAKKVTGLYAVEAGALRIGRFEYRKGQIVKTATISPKR